MRIAVDVDGVLAQRVPAQLLSSIKDLYGVEMIREDIGSFHEPIPTTDKTIHNVIDEHQLDEKYLMSTPPVPGAKDGIDALRDRGNDVVITTHRDQELHSLTQEWLQKHEITYDDYETDVPETKAEVEADVLIDDYYGHVEDAAEYGMIGILFLQPWNMDHVPSHERVKTISNWNNLNKVLP